MAAYRGTDRYRTRADRTLSALPHRYAGTRVSRLGSYARRHSVYQGLAEIGRVHKTVHILKTLDDEAYRRRMGRELNKGEASHDLSRFLCFGKEGVLRGREFGDQLHTFSCLSILHNAVVAWNMIQMDTIVAQ
jgi:TnpA family transposase